MYPQVVCIYTREESYLKYISERLVSTHTTKPWRTCHFLSFGTKNHRYWGKNWVVSSTHEKLIFKSEKLVGLYRPTMLGHTSKRAWRFMATIHTTESIISTRISVKKQLPTRLWYDSDRTENEASTTSSIVLCINCHWNVSTEPLPSNDTRGYTYRHTDWWKGFMKYAVETGSGTVIYLPSFIKIGSVIQKLIGGIHRQHSDRINLL
jgi:hypothetical protein